MTVFGVVILVLVCVGFVAFFIWPEVYEALKRNRTRLAEMNAIREENTTLQRRVEELKRDVAATVEHMTGERENALRRLDEFVDVSNREMVRMNGEVAEMKKENERLKGKMSSVDDAAEILRERWEALQKENDALKAELADTDGVHVQNLRHEIIRVRSDLAFEKQRYKDITDALEPIRIAMGWVADDLEE